MPGAFVFGDTGLAAEGDNAGPEAGVRSQDSVIKVAVNARRGDQAGDGVQDLERREGEEVDHRGWDVRAGRRPDGRRRHGTALPARARCGAVKGEGRPGAVAEEPLAACAVGAVAADGGIEAEATGALPGEHIVYGILLEEAAAVEEAEDAAQEDGFEDGDVVGREVVASSKSAPSSTS